MSDKNKFDFANSVEINKRKSKISHFTNNILDSEEEAIFVSDEASIYDISTDDEEALLERVEKVYGVILEVNDFLLPIWKLVDLIDSKKSVTKLLDKS
jgi:hypothetical protein